MSKTEELNVNLGLPAGLTDPFLKPRGLGRQVLAVLATSALPLEVALLRLCDALPARLRHGVVVVAWWLWLALHRALPGRLARRGLHGSLSLEMHAISNVFWWARLLPMSVRKMRFMLGQMDGIHLASRSLVVEPVNVRERGVRGLYLRISKATEPCVLFWIFGGAYAGGGTDATAGLAERYGRALGCDVFLVDMRLCPEHKIQDAYVDACRGYEWLLSRVPADRVVLYGMSSGGGVALRVLQLARAEEDDHAACFSSAESVPQPAGAVLCGPWVRYTTPSASMARNNAVDLVVNQSVFELLQPAMGSYCGGEPFRQRRSPLYHDMAGLCPLLLSASEHEVCIDEDRELAQKAKEAGVHVDLDIRPYLPHAFQWFAGYVPEATEAQERIISWIRGRGPAWDSRDGGEAPSERAVSREV